MIAAVSLVLAYHFGADFIADRLLRLQVATMCIAALRTLPYRWAKDTADAFRYGMQSQTKSWYGWRRSALASIPGPWGPRRWGRAAALRKSLELERSLWARQ